MTATATPAPTLPAAVEAAVAKGDLSQLSSEQRLQYLHAVCSSLGLNGLTRPFDFLTNKKTGVVTLYARKECAAQLASIRGVTTEIVSKCVEDGVYTVHVRASCPHGKGKRHHDNIGCVAIQGLSGEQKANAMMHAVTKAERRAVLALCGLGAMDESEVADARDLLPAPQQHAALPAPAVPALPAPPPQPQPQPQPPDTAGMPPPPSKLADVVAQIRGEYAAAKLTPQQWAQFSATVPWLNNRKPTELMLSEAESLLGLLRAWLRPTAGPDGLPQGGTGAQPAGFPGAV